MSKTPWTKIQKTLQSPFHLWLFVMSLCALSSVLITVLTNGEWITNALYRQGKNFIADYSMHVLYARHPAELYGLSAHASFPPLAYALYAFLYRVSPLPAQADIAVGVLPAAYSAMLVHLVYLVVLSSFFTLLVQCFLRKFPKEVPSWKAALCVALLLISNVFVVGIFERGNSAWIALLFLMAAMLLRDSPSAAKREAALFCIAIAASFKLYPAIFGLLYLKEKRYPEALRLLLYGLALFFLPFFFFGGVGAIGQFFQNQSIIHLAASKWTVGSVGVRLISAAGLTLSPAVATAVSHGVALLFVAISLTLFWSVRSQPLWKDLILLVGIMVLAPSWSGVYTFPYFLLPMLMFFGNQAERKSPVSIVYALLFVGVFVPLLVFSYGAIEWIAALSAYALVFLVWGERVELLWQLRRKKK